MGCKTVINIFNGVREAGKRVFFGWKLGLACCKQQTKPMLELMLTNEQKIQVTLAPVTATGKPAPLDGTPEWSVISGNSTLEVASDGKSAFLVSADDPGDSQFLVKADADLGEGKEEISDTIKLSVAGARAANLGLVAGTPVAK